MLIALRIVFRTFNFFTPSVFKSLSLQRDHPQCLSETITKHRNRHENAQAPQLQED